MRVMQGIEMRRVGEKNKYDSNSRDKLCNCCDEKAAIEIVFSNKKKTDEKVKKNSIKIYLCEKHRDDLKTFISYFS